MAYISIPDSIIKVGDAIKKELWDTIKGNFDDHEERLNNFEAGAVKIPVFKMLVNNKTVSPVLNGVAYYKVDQNFNVTYATVQIFEKGSLTGTLEIDIKKSLTDLADGSFSSIFTTKPKITFATDANYAISGNQVLNNNAICLAGETLRLDITSVPGGGLLTQFIINVYGEI